LRGSDTATIEWWGAVVMPRPLSALEPRNDLRRKLPAKICNQVRGASVYVCVVPLITESLEPRCTLRVGAGHPRLCLAGSRRRLSGERGRLRRLGGRQTFVLEPDTLLVCKAGLYPAGFSQQHQEVRTFALDGFREVEWLKGEGEPATGPRIQAPRARAGVGN
jgi:hypothetical protein